MRKIWLFIPVVILGSLLIATAQTPQPDPKVKQATLVAPAKSAPLTPRDISKLPENAQAIGFGAERAMDWLKRAVKPDGRFVYGFQPALRVQLDGDNFPSQAGAVFALARSARYFRDEGATAKARHVLLTLKLETMLDPDDKTGSIRYTAAPPSAVDRLSSHGLLISAIHSLDSAEKCKDLLDGADQLCNYLRLQQRPDGSLFVMAGSSPIKSGSEDLDAERAGWALQGIIRSHKHRPADWKLDMLRKARAHYYPQWQQNKNVSVVYSHTPAYAEAYLLTKDDAFRDAVYAMNDWLLGLQYRDEFDAVRKHWAGGFRLQGGKGELSVPDIRSALPAESLADACRVAREAGNLVKLKEYQGALVRNLHFVMSLQYTADKTRHFVDPFRPSVLGAFHASHQDGNIRIDYTQHALCAMVQYLDAVVE
jgi:hypothetical protein